MPSPQFRPTRRLVLGASAALSATLALPGILRAEGSGAMHHRGVVYDTGTDIGYPDYLSRMSWHESDVRREIAVIREQLHCNVI